MLVILGGNYTLPRLAARILAAQNTRDNVLFGYEPSFAAIGVFVYPIVSIDSPVSIRHSESKGLTAQIAKGLYVLELPESPLPTPEHIAP